MPLKYDYFTLLLCASSAADCAPPCKFYRLNLTVERLTVDTVYTIYSSSECGDKLRHAPTSGRAISVLAAGRRCERRCERGAVTNYFNCRSISSTATISCAAAACLPRSPITYDRVMVAEMLPAVHQHTTGYTRAEVARLTMTAVRLCSAAKNLLPTSCALLQKQLRKMS